VAFRLSGNRSSNNDKHGLELTCCERRKKKMADIEIKTEVKKPVEEVFKFVADIPNYPKWAPPSSSMFIENKVSPGPIGVGTTFEDKLHYGRVTGKVVEFKPYERIVFEQKWYPDSHVMEMRVEYGFAPSNGNTQISHNSDIIPVELFTPMKGLLTDLCREERQRTCDAIKTTLER
jgi:uncharacterized protein YndB with AHSA1/START domain